MGPIENSNRFSLSKLIAKLPLKKLSRRQTYLVCLAVLFLMALLGASAVDLGPGANEFKLIYMPFYYTFLRRLAAYERVAPAVQTSAKRRQR